MNDYRLRAAPKKEIAVRLNRLAVALNAAQEELSALRHELGVLGRMAAQQPRRDYEVEE